MTPQITMREILILVICFVLYVVAVEVFEQRVDISRQGQLVQQEQSFRYEPPSPPVTQDGTGIVVETPGN
jgi:hypothetical protein